MGVVLALGAAIAYGLSDFVGGLTSRRTTPWPVAFLAAVGGLVGAIALALVRGGDPVAADLAWGALAGLGSGAGSVFLYRGLATGRMGVVAPLSGVGAAVLPVVVGVATGERPAPLVWVGIAVAVPAIWCVARVPGDASSGERLDPRGAGVADGALAGVGFGLIFIALGQVPDGAGYWPLAISQGVSLVLIAATAALLGTGWMPHHREQWWGLAAGLLASGAVLSYLLATQHGSLSAAAVLTSFYPAVTVVLAALVLRERIHRVQSFGLVLAAAAVALIAGG